MRNPALTILLLIALLFTACRKEEDNTVLYRVVCSECTVGYMDPAGTTRTTDAVGEWTYTFDAHSGQRLELGAVNLRPVGTVYVYIEARGRTLDSHSNGQPFGYAQAATNMP